MRKTSDHEVLKMVAVKLIALLLTIEVGAVEAGPSGDTIVFGSGKRVHVEGCPRLTKDSQELARLTKATLDEALANRAPNSAQDVRAVTRWAKGILREVKKADTHGIRGAVLLRNGTYYLGQGLNVPDGVVLRGEGDGEDGTVLK